jgi:hypothetical protein
MAAASGAASGPADTSLPPIEMNVVSAAIAAALKTMIIGLTADFSTITSRPVVGWSLGPVRGFNGDGRRKFAT